MSYLDIQQKILEYEKNGNYNSHLFPVDKSKQQPVDINFPYIQKGFLKFKYFIANNIVVKPFRWYWAKYVYKTKVTGKNNTKNLKSAIVVSNHVAIFDCMVNSYVLKKHKIKIVGAEFNNKNTAFGECMRIGGMMPIGSSYEVMKKFNNAISYYLSKGRFVLIYPEEAMWPLYEKPRPLKNGAFFYAVKNDVPVLPMFITFRYGKKIKKDGTPRVYFTVNIGKPIYPNANLTDKENVEFLKQETFKTNKQIYEKNYNKTLE